MRLGVSRSKNAASLYVKEDYYIAGKRSTVVVEKLGTEEDIRKRLNGGDPYEWAKEYIARLNAEKQKQKKEVLVKFLPARTITANEQLRFNAGYLFLQAIYYELGLDRWCKSIAGTYRFKYDLNAILSRLLYTRILYPGSKKSSYELSASFLQARSFELQHVYRALEIIAAESDQLQEHLYKNSQQLVKRSTKILYYDCTNYFFEIEQAEGLKQYGHSKEHRPNPLVQMGLFMDGSGLPLAFSIHPGNTNEQVTLTPLESKVIKDFGFSKFIVCTDAGLSSYDNRRFNDIGERAYITTQSLKKLPQHLREWALDPAGWYLAQGRREYTLTEINKDRYWDKTFYKRRPLSEKGLEQDLLVTFSFKYQNYQETLRGRQVNRVERLRSKNPRKLEVSSQQDGRRFIKRIDTTSDGEVAEHSQYYLDEEAIRKEARYDGFYAVCTNLEEASPAEIIRINQRRWEIEESFRLLKDEFKARPVYLKRDDRIKAHFTTCFLALTIFRILEKRLQEKYTAKEITTCLRSLDLLEMRGQGFIPAYTRTDLTDALHDVFDFRTDFQIIPLSDMKRIFKKTLKYRDIPQV